MAAGENWNRDEITMACYIYLFSQRKKSVDYRMLSDITNRTVKSIGRKMENIARFDYEAIEAGRCISPNGSKIDGEVWKDFQTKPAKMITKAQELLIESGKITDLEIYTSCPADDVLYVDIGPGEERETIIKQRVNQHAFRRQVLNFSKNRCCVTGVSDPSLLVASHIKPWRESTSVEKTDIHNALCLNVTHDALFDRFLMTIDENDQIYYAPQLVKTMGEEYFENSVARYDRIKVTENNRPSPEYIAYHNKAFEAKNLIKIKCL